ncbi:type II toxin-antitoxin system RelE/ParE family toxin [Geomonas azotofigens]|uniref:type II toxin-antitoxin system RelE/ParE family toxin n=1 Tax=Geomonas azotofigens TaxID=2843196 RepID=UPI001C114665|nr:type II toxin-antitoxin system RelE/ParE family toxin [Geomonas azotofigens]MBU5613162.1 type II toxin-antitoxin system RelE/ParE family toxin [Geomonas azotofigens]
MKPRFTLTQKAVADLTEIARYTQLKWGREQRNKYLALLDSCFQQLAANPHKGKDCSDIRSGYRKFSVGGHVIFYRQLSDGVEIVRVLHKRMDLETRIAST